MNLCEKEYVVRIEYQNNEPYFIKWYDKETGKLDRSDGPALEWLERSDQIARKDYYIDGKFYTKQNFYEIKTK